MDVTSTIVAVGNTLTGIFDSVKTVAGTEVAVGISDEPRRPLAGQSGSPPPNSLIAYVQEFGDDQLNIPARPFFFPGLKDATPKIISIMGSMLLSAVMGRSSEVRAGYDKIGKVSTDAIKSRIDNGHFQPLAKGTIEARQRRGNMSEQPLIDSGQMRDAVTYTVQKKS